MRTIRPLLIALALAALSGAVRAQKPEVSEATQFAAIVSNAFAKLSDVIAERDTARTALAVCQAAANPPQPPPTPLPEKPKP